MCSAKDAPNWCLVSPLAAHMVMWSCLTVVSRDRIAWCRTLALILTLSSTPKASVTLWKFIGFQSSASTVLCGTKPWYAILIVFSVILHLRWKQTSIASIAMKQFRMAVLSNGNLPSRPFWRRKSMTLSSTFSMLPRFGPKNLCPSRLLAKFFGPYGWRVLHGDWASCLLYQICSN